MAISLISQKISTIPKAGKRGIDVQTTFVTKQEDFQDHLQGTTVSELNALATQINTTVAGMNSDIANVNTKASEADADALSASNSAGVATTKAGEASTKAGEASTSASQASASKNKAAQWADADYNVPVEAGKYSAKHWSSVAQNTVAGKVGKVTSTDNAVVRFNGTTGDVQNSAITIDDNGNIGSGAQSFNGFGGSGFKNYIINGNFDIWQYKDARLTHPQTSNSYGSDDRWFNAHAGSTKTHSQVSCTNVERALFNSSFFSRTVVSSVAGANNQVHKFQFIENVTKLAGKTVTVSFWAKADSAKNIAIEFGQLFGTGGSPSASVSGVGLQLIPLASTWQKITRTFTFPSIVGKTIGTDGVHTSSTYLIFWFDAGANHNSRAANLGQQSGAFDIAQVQLEEGSVATPFEQRPYGLELSLCRRYYEYGYVDELLINSGLTTNLGTGTKYTVSKRTIPTVTLSFGTLNQNREDGFTMYGSISAGQWLSNVFYTASAEL